MNRRDFLTGVATTAVAVVMPAVALEHVEVAMGYTIERKSYSTATMRIAESFRQTKETVLMSILNDHPLLGQVKWDEDGKQWCWDGERWVDEHRVWRIQDDEEAR